MYVYGRRVPTHVSRGNFKLIDLFLSNHYFMYEIIRDTNL